MLYILGAFVGEPCGCVRVGCGADVMCLGVWCGVDVMCLGVWTYVGNGAALPSAELYITCTSSAEGGFFLVTRSICAARGPALTATRPVPSCMRIVDLAVTPPEKYCTSNVMLRMLASCVGGWV